VESWLWVASVPSELSSVSEVSSVISEIAPLSSNRKLSSLLIKAMVVAATHTKRIRTDNHIHVVLLLFGFAIGCLYLHSIWVVLPDLSIDERFSPIDKFRK
jgi:hypothetical protein